MSLEYILSNFFQFRVIKYFLVGGLAAVTDISLFTLFYLYYGLGIAAASVASFLFAVMVNYYLGILLVFNSKERFPKYKEFLLVLSVSASGLLLNIGCTYFFVQVVDLGPVIAKFLAALPAFVWNYTLRRNFVFKSVVQRVS